jgi:hypothetical protein
VLFESHDPNKEADNKHTSGISRVISQQFCFLFFINKFFSFSHQ